MGSEWQHAPWICPPAAGRRAEHPAGKAAGLLLTKAAFREPVSLSTIPIASAPAITKLPTLRATPARPPAFIRPWCPSQRHSQAVAVSDLVAQATPATSPLRRHRPGPNPALDAGHMDRGGREDRRKGRRRSRSRSHEERRRRSSARGASRRSRSRSRSRSPERTRRNDRGNSKDVRPRLEPAAPAAQPSPEPAAPPAAAAAPVPGPAPTAQLVAPSRDNLRQLMATRSDLDALREVERQLVGE